MVTEVHPFRKYGDALGFCLQKGERAVVISVARIKSNHNLFLVVGAVSVRWSASSESLLTKPM